VCKDVTHRRQRQTRAMVTKAVLKITSVLVNCRGPFDQADIIVTDT
jgi:hypothetical protein